MSVRVGDGAVTKLIINGVMALGTAALAEGLAYGARAELDRGVLIDVLSDLILVSEHHKRKLAMAKAGDYPAEFPTRLMSKDMGLLLADAGARGASMPSMAAAAQLLRLCRQAPSERRLRLRHPRRGGSGTMSDAPRRPIEQPWSGRDDSGPQTRLHRQMK